MWPVGQLHASRTNIWEALYLHSSMSFYPFTFNLQSKRRSCYTVSIPVIIPLLWFQLQELEDRKRVSRTNIFCHLRVRVMKKMIIMLWKYLSHSPSCILFFNTRYTLTIFYLGFGKKIIAITKTNFNYCRGRTKKCRGRTLSEEKVCIIKNLKYNWKEVVPLIKYWALILFAFKTCQAIV